MKPFVKYVLLKNRWKILGAGGVLGAYTLIRLLPAAVLERFINSMQGVSDAKFHLVLLAALYLLSALSLYAAEIGKNYFSRKLAWNMTDELRVRLLARNLRMGQSFYNRYGTGEIIEHLDGDINVLESFISATMVPVLIDVLIQFSAGRKIRNHIVRLMIDSKQFKTDHVGSFLDILNYDVAALQYMLLTQFDLLGQLAFLIAALVILGAINSSVTLFIIAPILLLSYIIRRLSERYRCEYAEHRLLEIHLGEYVQSRGAAVFLKRRSD